MSLPTPLSPRLVIIDDHAALRQLLAQALGTKAGFEIVGQASTAREGLTLCEQVQPDVAVLDMKLPDASGLDQVRAIRRLSPYTRVVVFSGNTDPALVRRALEVGVHGYVQKEADLSELVHALKQVAGGSLCFSRHLLPDGTSFPFATHFALADGTLAGTEAHITLAGTAGKLGFGLAFLGLVLAWAVFINSP